jgi:hypothetical protein
MGREQPSIVAASGSARVDAQTGLFYSVRMRVLFLDFGGVLHPSGHDDEARAGRGGDGALARLDLFCWFDVLHGLLGAHPDVFVVVHSNWRHVCTPEEIGDLLGDLGRRYLGCVAPGDRHAAIRAWLARHPGVETYRILDDSARAFGDPPPAELILCDPRTGVSEPRVQAELRAWLQAGQA